MFKFGGLQKVLQDMKDGVYDYTIEGRCSDCGACCSNLLPMSAKEVKIIRAYIRKHGIREQKHLLPAAQPFRDMVCPFRDNTNRACTIYEVRPAICRDFQCDKPRKRIEADKRMYHAKLDVYDLRKTFFDQNTNFLLTNANR